MTKKDMLAEELWETGWIYIKNVVDTAHEPFVVLDENFKVLAANDSFYDFFHTTAAKTEKKSIYGLGNNQWDIPQLHKLLEEIIPRETFFKNFEVDHDFPLIGRKIMVLNARRVYPKKSKVKLPVLILLAMEDATKNKMLEEQLARYAAKLENKVVARTKDLSDRLTEVEKMNKIMIDRELKMVELKKEITDMKKLMLKKKK